jgi:hypothetical protein
VGHLVYSAILVSRSSPRSPDKDRLGSYPEKCVFTAGRTSDKTGRFVIGPADCSPRCAGTEQLNLRGNRGQISNQYTCTRRSRRDGQRNHGAAAAACPRTCQVHRLSPLHPLLMPHSYPSPLNEVIGNAGEQGHPVIANITCISHYNPNAEALVQEIAEAVRAHN